MGLIGRYIAALSDEALDRVLEAQSWRAGLSVDDAGARCLVGHAEDYQTNLVGLAQPRAEVVRTRHREDRRRLPARFDRMVARFGLTRTVALVKARAGKRTRVDVSQHETSAAATREASLVG